MSSRLLRAACIGFCASFLALAASPAAKPNESPNAKAPKKAEKPVGTVYANGPMRVRGIDVRGGTEWPVFAGDVIETKDETAVLKLKDGRWSRIAKLSAAALVGSLSALEIRFNRGTGAVYDPTGKAVEPTLTSPLTVGAGKASIEPRLAPGNGYTCKPNTPSNLCYLCQEPNPPANYCWQHQ